MTVTLESIRAAAVTIRGEVIRTPIVRSGPLSDATGVEIFLKLETLQRTGSFKDRGAFVKLKSVSQEGGKGVIAISAGNHAQGVAAALGHSRDHRHAEGDAVSENCPNTGFWRSRRP